MRSECSVDCDKTQQTPELISMHTIAHNNSVGLEARTFRLHDYADLECVADACLARDLSSHDWSD
jgi:hypothetical protein